MPEHETLSIMDLANALLLYDEPILDSRFHLLLASHPDEKVRRKLQELPGKVTKIERSIRAGAFRWGHAPDGKTSREFVADAERVLLEAFLHLTESEIRLIAYMAKKAPMQEIRGHFDEAAQEMRGVAGVLRDAIPRSRGETDEPAAEGRRPLRSVQNEADAGDLRGQLEDAIRRMRDAGKEPRSILMSHTAQRHLRDQGLFREGETQVLGVPVMVDLEWETPSFAIQSFNSMPLDEMMYVESREREKQALGR